MIKTTPPTITVQRAIAFGALWGILAIIGESRSGGEIAAALAVVIAGTVTLTYGPLAIDNVTRLITNSASTGAPPPGGGGGGSSW